MQKSLFLPVVFSWDSINLLCSTLSQFFLFNQSQVLLKIIIRTKLVLVLICNLQYMLHFKFVLTLSKTDWLVLRSRNYWLSDGISDFTATSKVAPVDGPINNWVCSLMEMILTIVNANYYYYFYWTDSVFLNGWLTVSEAANCLTDLVECFSDSVIDWQLT